MGQLYECVLFTASLAKYADPVADLLDKWGVFRSRLFRESCVFYRGNYVKDLGRLGRDLHKVVIVDNSPASYIFHPDNAVPVASWFDNVHDTELRDLIPFFEKLSKVENIYTVLRNANHVSLTPGHSPDPSAHVTLNSVPAAAAALTSDQQSAGGGGAVFTNHNTSANSTPTLNRADQQSRPMPQHQSYPLLPLTGSKSTVEAPASPGSVIHSSTLPPPHPRSSNSSLDRNSTTLVSLSPASSSSHHSSQHHITS